jgi:hypothetical protein
VFDNNRTEVRDAIKVLLTLVGFRIATFTPIQELPVAASFEWSHWIKQEHVERCTCTTKWVPRSVGTPFAASWLF